MKIQVTYIDRVHAVIVHRPGPLEGEAIRMFHTMKLTQAINYAALRGERLPLVGARA